MNKLRSPSVSDVTAEQTNQVKLFFQKAVAVIIIVNFMSVKDCKEWRDGGWVYAQDRLYKYAYLCSYLHMMSSTYETLLHINLTLLQHKHCTMTIVERYACTNIITQQH